MADRKGYLVLEDGSVFSGIITGGAGNTEGEVVFNTSMSGYEQVITDPSYAGQIVVMTYPLIGNYGVNPANTESDKPWVRGLVVNDLCDHSGHYEQEMSLEEYLEVNNLVCLRKVDTRAITRLIRERGTMGGLIVDSIEDIDTLVQKAQSIKGPAPGGYVMQVTRQDASVTGSGQRRIVLVDFGVKKSIIKSLVKRGCEVISVPADTAAEKILELKPDGVVLSNGPGDPRDCRFAVENIKDILGRVPVFGICLGHQLLALALGGNTYKMTFGHRGGNQPVKDLETGRVFITSQNHGYVVDEDSLKVPGVELSFKNINDGTVEGMRHNKLSFLSVQFHPEASPGPQDTCYLFDEFIKMTA